MALSLSLLIGSITILATTLFQGRAMAPSMLCKPFLPIVRQLSYYGAVQYGAVVLQSSTSTYRVLPLDGLPSNYLEP